MISNKFLDFTVSMEDENGGFIRTEIEEFSESSASEDLKLPLTNENICIYCGGVPLSAEMKNIFNLKICKECRFKKVKFITKTRCKEDYLLNEDEILNFKYLTRPNPHKGTWNDMQLYIEEEIRDFSLKKFGTEAQIEEIKKERIQKNKKQKIERIKKKVKEMKNRTFIHPKKEKHIHKFIRNGKKSICDCGMIIEQEEL